MKHIPAVIAALTFTLSNGIALADTQPDYCGPNGLLQTKINQSMQERVRNSAPTQAPGDYVQNNYDIQGILSQDVTAGFSKLLNLNFGNITQTLVNNGIQSVRQKASGAFSNSINGVIGQYGANPIVMSGVNAATTSVNTVTQAAANTVQQTVTPSQSGMAGFVLGPYTTVKNAISGFFGK